MLKKHPYLQVLSLKETPVAIGIFTGKNYLITFANPLFCVVSGKQYKKIINKPLWHAIPEVQGQGFEKLLEGVLTTGIPYIGSETPVKLKRKGRLEVAYFSFVFNPLRNEEGQITDIMVIATEVTDKVLKEQAAESERQHFYKLLMQAPAIIVIIKGPHHVIEFANSLALQILRTQGNVIGKPLIEAMPELLGQPFIRILNTVRKTGKMFVGNEIPAMLNIDGSGILEKRFYNFVYQPNIDLQGKVDGILIHAIDVTEQVLAQKRIRENERHLWNVLESISDAFISYDNQWRYVYVNKAACKIIGKPSEELIGKIVWKDTPELRITEGGRMLLKAARTKKTLTYQTFYPPNQTWFDVQVYPGKNGVATTFRDITEEKKGQTQVISKDKFKTPVRSLKTTVQILQHTLVNNGNKESAQLLEKMNKQIDKLINLIQDSEKKS